MSSSDADRRPRALTTAARDAFGALARLAAKLGNTVSSQTAQALVGPLGVVAQAFDDTPEAATLRRLRVGAVSIPSAPPERQAAFVRALREVVAALGPAVDAPAASAAESSAPAPPPLRRAPAASVRRRTAETPIGTKDVAEAAAPVVPAPPAQRPRRAAPTVTPPPEAAPQPGRPDHVLPPTPEAAAFERLCPTPLTALPGVGPSVATRLEAAGIRDIGDLLLLRPRKYQDRRDVTPIAELTPGEFAVVHGRITRASAGFGGGGGRRFMMDVTDETGTLVCTFFRINTGFASRQWTVGREVTVAGPVTLYRERCQMAHPAVDVGDAASSTGELRPVYPEIEGVGERVVRKLVRAALDGYAGELPESLPPAVLERTGLPSLEHALRRVHAPPPDAEPAAFLQFRDPSLRRFIFDELLALQLALGFRRRTADARAPAPIAPPADLDAWLQRVLPFAPTGAQRRVIGHIRDDLVAGRPMNRLLQGDVGSGKTAVAYAAARLMQGAGYQTALMAPTEILAQQHLRTLAPLFEAAGLRAAVLTNGLPRREQRLIRELTLAGAVHCLIGTHSLLSEDLGFARLGLAIVDEQHRFGVRQRLALRQKALVPHLLVMTATPIPRTLALTAYGDLEVSVLDELPPGRLPVKTTMHRRTKRDEVFARVRSLIAEGRQAYVVFPLVEESEASDLADATSSFEALSAGAFAGLRVGLVHGRMAAEAKDAALRTFAAGDLDVLVTTTVIEVGIDVPNASVMIIEHAERFGLSQLHQLRGRVGRGGHAGYCLLLCDEQPTDDALERLRTMVRTQDGFEIAQADLEQRGPGEVLGTRQAGVTDLQIADLVRDAALVELAREVATEMLAVDPQLRAREHAVLRRVVWSKWGERLELVEAG